MEPWPLFLSIFAGAIGTAIFVYGKRQSSGLAMAVGVTFGAVPLLVDPLWGQGLGYAILIALLAWGYRRGL